MPIIRVSDHVEAYRIRALAPDLHQMAGRDHKEALTQFVNSEILHAMDLEAADVFLDVGCGDGCLIRQVAGVSQRIGIVPTKEERDRLTAMLPNVDLYVGLAQKLPLGSGTATKIVCNSVLLLMKSEHDVVEALREIARVAKPGAMIWIGEIPTIDEFAQYKMYCGTSIAGLLWYLLKNHGVRTFLGMCRKLIRSTLGREALVLNSARLYNSSPDHFIALAEGCGLRLDNYFKHRELDSEGRIVDSAYRFNYVFWR
jgi:SAM-dependent methyltransferase